MIRIFTDENYLKLAATAFCGLDPATSSQSIMNPFPALAAIGNAVFHATGKRVRDLPITIDKLL